VSCDWVVIEDVVALVGVDGGRARETVGLLFFQESLTPDLLAPAFVASSVEAGVPRLLNGNSDSLLSGVTVLASECRVDRFSGGAESRSDSSSWTSFFSSNLNEPPN
jgi:hypothetical protein